MKTMDDVMVKVLAADTSVVMAGGETIELVEGCVSPNSSQTILRIPGGVYKTISVELETGGPLQLSLETVFQPSNVLQKVTLLPGQHFCMPAQPFSVLLVARNSSWHELANYLVRLTA